MRIEIAVDARNGVGEGPWWDDADGTLWWVDIPAKLVLAWRPGESGARRFTIPDMASAVVGRKEGGFLLAVRDGIYTLDPATGETALYLHHEPDRPDNRTNEAKVDPLGRFWIGTMQNNLNPDGSGKEMTGSFGALYCLRPDRRITREVDGIGLSNTLAWSPNGRTMLFADTMTNIIQRYDVDDDGHVSNPRVFSDEKLPGHCDGSAIDAQGFLWNARFAAGRLIRFAPDGKVDSTIELPVTNPTSCAFGGPDLKTLYVTSARHGLSQEQLQANPHEGALLAVHANVEGTPSYRFAG
jgi:sugar lactone lactonase YvrE